MNPSYGVTQYPTPLFNTPDIKSCFGGEDGDTLLLDEQGLMRTVETVLFPGTSLELLEKMAEVHIWRVKTPEYPYEGNFYIHDRFIQLRAVKPPPRKITLPPVPSILMALRTLQNVPYIWGGNWPGGIDLLSELYPSKTDFNSLDPLVRNTWRLQGVDCSGLIYYLSEGFPERNTSRLVNFGEPIDIEGKDPLTIRNKCMGLDYFAWNDDVGAHVVIVLDHLTTIESIPSEGVILCDSLTRITQIMQERKPVNRHGSTSDRHFVARRWHPHNRESTIQRSASL